MTQRMITKAELIADVAANKDQTKALVTEIVDDFLDLIISQVSENVIVKIAGFGKFTPRYRAARDARNPRTGETVKSPASVAPRFTPAKNFKDDVKKHALKHVSADEKKGAKGSSRSSTSKTTKSSKTTKPSRSSARSAPAKAPARKPAAKAPAKAARRGRAR